VTRKLLALNARTFASLRNHHNYRLWFSGQLVSLIGSWMQNIALAWLVVELTSSPLAVGALAFFRFVPFTAFGLFAGVVGMIVVVMAIIAAIRLLDEALPSGVWLPYLILGVLFVIAGALVFRKRKVPTP